MRTVIVLISIILSGSTFSQVNDVDSLRWHRIMRTKNNQVLFEYKTINDSTLIGTFQKCAIQGDKVFFLESKDIAEIESKYFELIPNPIIDSLHLDNCEFLPHWKEELVNDNDIIIAYNGLVPFQDAEGNIQSGIDLNTGFEYYSYPSRTITHIPSEAIEEIRIKEIKMYNDSTETYEYIPVSIQITPQLFGNHRDGVWIDLNKLIAIYPAIEKTRWYDFVMKKEYSGKQYMQL